MDNFNKAVDSLRDIGVNVTVQKYEVTPLQIATIKGENLSGGFANYSQALLFDDEELDIIRELFSHIACGYEREDFLFHCCDANEIIKKIDDFRKK